MSRRSFSLLLAALAILALAAWPRSAAAAKGDAAATKAADHAMNDLFMATKFDEAKRTLEATIEQCSSGCSDKTRARLYRDLGVVDVTGFHDTKGGRNAFKKARSLDPGIALDPVITTPEIQSVFDASAGGGGGEESSRVEEAAASVVLDADSDDEGEGGKKKKRKRRHVEESEHEEAVVAHCSKDDDCDKGQACQGGVCGVRPPAPYEPVVWLSLGLIEDMMFLSGTDVCTQKSQVESGFTCLRASGSQYHGTPLPGKGGSISFTPALASTRITLASYIPFGPLSAGLRMGYVLAGQGPQADGGKSFVFYQAEAIGAYWFSGSAFSTKHLGTFIQVSGGVAEIDASTKVTVTENPNAIHPAGQFFDNPPTQTLDAYQKSGSGFAGAGAGLFLPFGSAAGLLADLRFSVLFPTSGFALSLGVSGVLGL